MITVSCHGLLLVFHESMKATSTISSSSQHRSAHHSWLGSTQQN